jgi:spore maturation protein CgeB
MTSWLSDNLSALERQAPECAREIARASAEGVAASSAWDGTPILVTGCGPLHNTHAPLGEARRWVNEQLSMAGGLGADTLIVLGFGAGHHLKALLDAWPKRIIVIEPNLAVLRAAFELSDLRGLLARVELRRNAPEQTEVEGLGRSVVSTFPPALASDRAAFREIRRIVHGRVGRQWLRLKILVVSPLHGGTLPMTWYAAHGLAALGHAVSVLDVSPFDAGFRRIPAFGATGRQRETLAGRFVDFLAEGILSRVAYEQPDLVLALAQAPMTGDLLERLSAAGVRTALWFVEDFRRFTYWQDLGPLYRYVFPIQRDECLTAFAAAGIGHVHYLPCAADPAVHTSMQLTEEETAQFGSSVSFVGAGYRNRRMSFRRLVDFDLKIWGSEWEKADGLWGRAVQRDGARLSPADSVRVFNASAINLNLHSSTYVDGVDPLGDFVNPRTFELAACGAFQLVDERRYLPELFEPGVEIATFGSAAELREKIRYYLARPDERAAIAAAGRRRVLAEHTYAARMGELIEHVLGCDYEHFRQPRASTHGTSALVQAAGPETALGTYLQRACGELPDVSLDDLAVRIQRGQGALSEEEEILLFLKQYDDMFLTAYRP